MSQPKGREQFVGMLCAIMTPTTPDGKPDLDRLVQIAGDICSRGADGVIYAGSMGEWPLLNDKDRRIGVEKLCDAGLRVIVGTGHPNPVKAAELAAHAARVGASGLMIIPRQSSRVSVAAAQRIHFSNVLKAGAPLPAVVYNSPYYGFSMAPDLFRSLRSEHRNLVGFKEFGGAADLTRDAQGITAGDESLALLAGVDTEVPHAYINCGAVGAITGIGNVLPVQVKYLIRLCEYARTSSTNVSQARELALQLERAMYELARFDEGPDLVLYYKLLMRHSGVKGYEVPLLAGDELSPSQAAFAIQQYDQFMRFWDCWDGRDFLK